MRHFINLALVCLVSVVPWAIGCSSSSDAPDPSQRTTVRPNFSGRFGMMPDPVPEQQDAIAALFAAFPGHHPVTLDEQKRARSFHFMSGTGQLRDEHLAHVGKLTTLKKVDISGTEHVTDAGMASLRTLSQVTSLDLFGGEKLTNESLKTIGGLTSLETLSLRLPTLDQSGLEHLTGLKNLKSLALRARQFDFSALSKLAALPKLTSLSLSESGVKDEHLQHVSALRNLKHLDLSENPEISDTGIGHLKLMTQLEDLNLGSNLLKPFCATRISKSGMTDLTALKNLKRLNIHKCIHIDADVLAQFRQAMPNCRVAFTDEEHAQYFEARIAERQ